MNALKSIVRRIVPTRLWGQLRAFRRRFDQATFQQRIVRHRYGSVDLNVWLTEGTGLGWYDRNYPEFTELTLLQTSQLRKGARVLDVGAHQSVIAMVIGDIVGKEGQVIAVEGDAHNADVGRKNCELNGMKQVTVVHGVGAEKSGTIAFSQQSNGQVDDGSGAYGPDKSSCRSTRRTRWCTGASSWLR